MRSRLSLTIALATVASLVALPASAIPSGVYFTLGIGGATVSGERGVLLKSPSQADDNEGYIRGLRAIRTNATDNYSERVRSDFGSGFGFQLRLGYTIKGYVSLEAAFSGHGNPGAQSSGIGHVSFQARYHFVNHITPFDKRAWDVDAFLGVGYSVGGYHPDPAVDDDAKAWRGWNITTGFAFRYQVGKRVSLGVDAKFVLPQFTTWVANWSKDHITDPEATPSTVVFIPTFEIVFHL